MSGEKTEEPTEEKLRKSREKGQVPSRKNMLEAVIITAGVGVVAGTWSFVVEEIAKTMDIVVQSPTRSFGLSAEMMYQASQGLIIYTGAVAVFLGVLTLLANLLLNQFNFAPKALEPKFEKLNPVNGFKNMFSWTTVYNFVRMTVIFLTISVVCYVLIVQNLRDGVEASICGMQCLAEVFSYMVVVMTSLIILVLLICAAIDYRIQDALFKKQQKMTKDEVKREYKDSEGNPEIKGARHNIAEENIYLPTMREVTHVVYSSTALVALMHVPNSAPYVVMKGTGSNVSKLQQKFRAMGKKCVNLPGPATELHKIARIGQYIQGKSGARSWFKVLAATGDM